MPESDAPGADRADRRALPADRQTGAGAWHAACFLPWEQEAISGAPVLSLRWTKLGSGLGLRLAHRWPPRLLFGFPRVRRADSAPQPADNRLPRAMLLLTLAAFVTTGNHR
jgi:hypothetical protein